MSFKTSVLIWFSRSVVQPHPQLTGWGFCVRQKHKDIFFNDMGLGDRVTNEHKGGVTLALKAE